MSDTDLLTVSESFRELASSAEGFKEKLEEERLYNHKYLDLISVPKSYWGKVKNIPSAIRNILANFPEFLVLAGGCVRGTIFDTEYGDFDLFCLDIDTAKAELRRFKKLMKALGAEKIFECPDGYLYSYKLPLGGGKYHKVQLINRDKHKDVQSILNSFDFTVCCFAYFENKLWALEGAFEDTANMTGNLVNFKYPVSAIKRIVKYTNKGFNMSTAMIDLSNCLVELGLKGVSLTDSQSALYID